MVRTTVTAIAVVAAAGCHVRSRVPTTRPGDTTTQVRQAEARALAAAVTLGDDGLLRFVTPLRCPADVIVEVERSETVKTEANLATFVVGMVVTAVGAVGVLRGASTDDASGSGYTWLGAGGIAAGLPLAIAPWFGNGETDVDLGRDTVRKGAAEVACGERAVAARRARLVAGDLAAVGAVDDAGRFAISPFAFVDAFADGAWRALPITATLDTDGGEVVVEGVIEASALAAARDAWLAAAGIDARVEVVRKLPRLAPGRLGVSRLTVDGATYLHLTLPLANDGPGDAWQVRGVVSAGHPELDGRVVYVGHLAPGAAITAAVMLPLSPAADAALAGDELELTLALRDAHDTAPSSPVRFRGKVLAGAPR